MSRPSEHRARDESRSIVTTSSRPLRVLFVNENLGGHTTVHHHLQQVISDHHPEVAATFFNIPPPGPARWLLGASVPGLGRLDLDLQPLRALLAQSAITHRFLAERADDFDVIHAYTQNSVLLSASLLSRRPFVVSQDATDALVVYRLAHRKPTRWTPRVLPALQVFEQRVYGAATSIVANSEFTARSLREHYGAAEPKLRLFPFGITAPDPGAAPATGNRGGSRPRVTFTGRELERKGGVALLEGWRRCLKPRCTLTLVTHDSIPPEEGLEVRGDVRPGDGQIWDILRSTDVYAFPSAIDLSPNAVLEAMAMGVPVVASATGAVPEMIEHGVSGFLTDIGDHQAVIAHVDRLLDDVDLRHRMGAAARRRFLDRYDARRTTEHLVTVLMEAAGRPCSPAGSER